MNLLNQIFGQMNEQFSKIEYEFSFQDNGMKIETIIDGVLQNPPKIILGITERDVQMWAYDENPIHMTIMGLDGIPLREKKVEWYDIPVDQELLKAYFFEHRNQVKKINDDGTY